MKHVRCTLLLYITRQFTENRWVEFSELVRLCESFQRYLLGLGQLMVGLWQWQLLRICARQLVLRSRCHSLNVSLPACLPGVAGKLSMVLLSNGCCWILSRSNSCRLDGNGKLGCNLRPVACCSFGCMLCSSVLFVSCLPFLCTVSFLLLFFGLFFVVV